LKKITLFTQLTGLLCLLLSATSLADNFAYVPSGTNQSKSTHTNISVINTNTGQLVTTITPEQAGPAVAILPNSDGTRVYFVTSSQNGDTYIHTIDTSTNVIIGTREFSTYNEITGALGYIVDGAALSPDDRWLLIPVDANQSSDIGSVSAFLVDLKGFDAKYPILTMDLNHPEFPDPYLTGDDIGKAQSTTFSPDGRFAFIVRSFYWSESIEPSEQSMGSFVSSVTLIDMDLLKSQIVDNAAFYQNVQNDWDKLTGQHNLTLTASNPAVENGSAGIAVSADPLDPEASLRIFVANSVSDSVSMLTIDESGLRPQLVETATIEFDADEAPYALAVSPDNKTLYVSLSRRWDAVWLGSPTEGHIASVDIEHTDTLGEPEAAIPRGMLSAPGGTTLYPQAISMIERAEGEPGDMTLVVLKNARGSGGEQTRDGYYVGTVDITTDPIRGIKVYNEVSSIQTSSSNTGPVYFNSVFVGQDCELCPGGPEPPARSRLNSPTALSPWLILLLLPILLLSRRIKRA
jgi:DNA-binding beta-propeller fold protein YncE